MKNIPQLLALALLLATSTSGAEDAAPESPSSRSQRAAHAQLSPGLERHAVFAHFADTEAHFWGCKAPCTSGGEDALVVEIPPEARGKKRRVKITGTKEHPVLWVRWGTEQDFYSMLVVGAQSEAEGKEHPRLVLKGWAGEKSKSGVTLAEEGKELRLSSAPQDAFCGRRLPLRTRVLRPDEGRFVTVRAPALSEKERKSAHTIQAMPVEKLDRTLIGLSSSARGSSPVPVDFDRKTAWQRGYEWVELEIPEGGGFPLVLEFAEPLTQATALYAVFGERVFQVEFSPQASPRYLLDAGDLDTSCVALLQPHTPAPLTEIMATSAGQLTTDELVEALERSDPGLAPAALAVRGDEAGTALGKHFSRMSPLGQARALQVARELPDPAGLPVFVSAVATGGPGREEATEALRLADREGAEALFERLEVADESSSGRLVVALTNLQPNMVAERFPTLFAGASEVRQAQLRAALGHVAKATKGRAVLARWFADSPPASLSRPERLELVRALGPELARVQGAAESLADLSEGADFVGAYLLAPLLVANFDEHPAFASVLSRWIRGEAVGKLSSQEQAALSVRVLDTVLERGTKAIRQSVRKELPSLLEHENMRVRRAALLNLARFESNVAPFGDQVVELLMQDDWPHVRAAAALAIVPVSERRLSGRTERIVLRRLHKDPDASVRRALARSLSDASGEQVVEAVRRSFLNDDDFSVRAEAAVSLGKLCDETSIDALTEHARKLGTGLTDEGAIELGLSSVTALSYLAPEDIDKRLEPLLSDKAPPVTRAQVSRRIESVRASKDRAICAR